MALDFLKLADDKLAKDFNKAAPETYMPKRREQVAKFAEAAAKAATSKQPKGPRKSYEISNGVAAARVRLGTSDLDVGGKEVQYVPAERLADYYTGVAKAARAGELDKHFDWEPDQTDNSGPARTSSRATREIKPELTHRRNVKRYGEDRANELLDKNVAEKGWNKAEVLKAYKALPAL